eukprot:540751_1
MLKSSTASSTKRNAIIASICCVLTTIIGITCFINHNWNNNHRSDEKINYSECELNYTWNMEDTAFASGHEAMVFKVQNNETNEIGAMKVYLNANDSAAGNEFKTKTGIIIRGPSSTTDIQSYNQELAALLQTQCCPFIIPLLDYSVATNIKSGITFKKERTSPVIITKYMDGGSLSDFIKNAERLSETISIDIIKLWNQQLVEASICAGKRGVQFTDRNPKNFVIDNHTPPNIYIIDISMKIGDRQNYAHHNSHTIKQMWRESIVRNSRNDSEGCYQLITDGSYPLSKMNIVGTISEVEDFLSK